MQDSDTEASETKNRVKGLVPAKNGAVVREARKRVVALLPLVREKLRVIVDGTSPLLVHAFSAKARGQMEDTQTGKIAHKGPRAKRVIIEEYAESLHWMSKRPKALTEASIARGTFGFPAGAFKEAMVDSAPYVGGGLDKSSVLAAVRVLGEMVQIRGDRPEMHQSIVRLKTGVPMTRYRGIFRKWWVALDLEFSASILPADVILNLLNASGFYMGVGEWRPQRHGTMGMYRVRTTKGA